MSMNIDPNSTYPLVAVDGNPDTSNLALDVEQASTAPGAPLCVQMSTGNASQQWKLIDMEDGAFQIVNANSDLRVTNSNGKAIQDDQDGPANQEWRLVPMGGEFEGQYQILEASRGFSLVPNGRNDGAQVRVVPVPRIWPPSGRWQISESSSK